MSLFSVSFLLLFARVLCRMLSASPERRVDLRRLYTLITYLEDGETRGSGGVVENTVMKALEEVCKVYSVDMPLL